MSFFLMFKVIPSFPPNQRPLTNFNYGNPPRVAPFYKTEFCGYTGKYTIDFDQSQRALRRTYVINSYMVYKMSFKFFYEGVNRAFKKIDAINQLSIQGCLGLKSKPSIECRPETTKELCQSPIMESYLILGTSYL